MLKRNIDRITVNTSTEWVTRVSDAMSIAVYSVFSVRKGCLEHVPGEVT